MKRGDIRLVALQGDYGKPRPAVIIQSDLFNTEHTSIVICPITSDLRDTPLFRVTIEPSTQNGLRKLSQIMLDKPHTVKRERLGERIGRLNKETLLRLDRSLMVFLNLP